MEELKQTITKEEIQAMDIEAYAGKMVVVDTEDAAQDAVTHLKTYSTIGFDTETKPCFQKGRSNKIALLQLATEDVCYLFRLNKFELNDALQDLLESDSIRKIGLSIKDDFSAIRKTKNLEPKNFVDLQSYVKKYGIEVASLQKIYALMFEKKISKSKRLSNWEAPELSEAQQHYAALDAWACLKIYEKLNKIKNNNDEQRV